MLHEIYCQLCNTYRMGFNFCRVYISQICNFRGFPVFKFTVAGYSGLEFSQVKYLQVYRVSPYTIIIYGSCRRAKLAGLDFQLHIYMAILSFWVSVIVLSYWPLFINPMATDLLCSAAATRVVLSTSVRTAFTIGGGTIFSKSGTMWHLGSK